TMPGFSDRDRGNRGGPPPGKFGNPGERLRKKHWNLDELPKFQKNFLQGFWCLSLYCPTSMKLYEWWTF
uniref:Uncharacterized protein n=1 Tax=Seriola dumerili TaxID=41447 RepID=A0A3B4V8F6_SERDU